VRDRLGALNASALVVARQMPARAREAARESFISISMENGADLRSAMKSLVEIVAGEETLRR
jgi:hypothetical protein